MPSARCCWKGTARTSRTQTTPRIDSASTTRNAPNARGPTSGMRTQAARIAATPASRRPSPASRSGATADSTPHLQASPDRARPSPAPGRTSNIFVSRTAVSSTATSVTRSRTLNEERSTRSYPKERPSRTRSRRPKDNSRSRRWASLTPGRQRIWMYFEGPPSMSSAMASSTRPHAMARRPAPRHVSGAAKRGDTESHGTLTHASIQRASLPQ